MDTFGRNILLKGELRATADITIEGTIDGHVLCEDGAVVFAPGSDVKGEVLARDVTIFGTLSGQIIATDVVDVRAEATVTAQVIARRFILDPDARFKGRIEPQHLDAALSVSRFQRRKR